MPPVQIEATLTSKGQITVPREVRRRLGLQTGDKLLFEEDGEVVRVRPVRKRSPFAKYRGIGNPGLGRGRKSIAWWLRQLRGEA
ncbi:MAG: AbrB/MazE/SpoVT family DNA-binding domain-containing protein [Acidobacteriaceae bacterium]